jgi:hypothetical protein
MNFRMLRKLSRRLEIITHFFHVFIEANSKITVPPILHMTYRVNNHSAANTELLKYRIRIFYKMPLLKNVWRLDINPERRGFAVWRSPMPWTMDAWCLDFKFFKAKIITQIGRYFYKCLKNSVFLKEKCLINAKSRTRETQWRYTYVVKETPQIPHYSFDQSAKTFGICTKKPYQASVVRLQCNEYYWRSQYFRLLTIALHNPSKTFT